MRIMRMPAMVALGCLFVAGCSSPPTPTAPAAVPMATTPVEPARFSTPAGATLSLPGCAALAQLNVSFGIATTTCPGFSGALQNVGAGCASTVHGTLVVSTLSGQQVGSASWSYPNVVRPGEQIVISGGRIEVPSSLQFSAQPTATWTDVSCS